jgi:ureidoglycolate hydrolase
MMQLQSISREKFGRYGVVIDFQPEDPDLIHLEGMQAKLVVKNTQPTGWRIATLHVQQKQAERLERHPDSKESFEPLDGVAMLLVAPPEDPNEIEAFLLDRPIILNEGVWHEIVSLSEGCTVKLVENAEVESDYFILEKPLKAVVG